MSYTMYTPLNVWLDPASVTDVVAYIQTYLSENTIYSETEIETIIHDYLIAHPELIGGVQSVNGKTGTVVLSASDINTEDDVTIELVLASLSSQISSIAASVATNTTNITSLTGRMTTAETDLTNLKSSFGSFKSSFEVSKNVTSKLESGYYNVNVDVGQVVSTEKITTDQWISTYFHVNAGDSVIVTARGGNNPRSYAVTDSDYKLIEKALPNEQYTNEVVEINTDGFVFINALVSSPYEIIYNTFDSGRMIDLNKWNNGFIANRGTVGSPFVGTKYTYAENWVSQFLRVKANDHFVLTARGGQSAVPYCVLNDSNIVQIVGDANSTVTDFEIDIKQDGYMIINALAGSNHSLYKRVITDNKNFIESDLQNVFTPISSVYYDSNTAYSYTDIIDGYDALVTDFPNNITKTELGKDQSGTYSIYKYEFTPTIPDLEGYQTGMGAKYASTDFPIVYMDACIHGGEYPSARALLNFMSAVYRSNNTSIYNWLKNHIKFIIVPVVNPYGYVNNTRGNANGVDINRNFEILWENGSSSAGAEYRGTAPLSEKESQYVDAILKTLINKNAIYFSWHTHGVWTSYKMMTCYSYPLTGDTYKSQRVAIDLIPLITGSGHENHELPLNSGLIGVQQVNNVSGTAAYQGTKYGIFSACPEGMYKYYDGVVGTDYSTKINCMNVEYITIAVMLAYKYIIETQA